MSEPAWVALGASVDPVVVDAKVDEDAITVAGTRLVATKLGASDTQPAFRILGDGRMEWGPGGSVAPDTNLYWAWNNILKTDDALQIGLDLTVGVAADSKLYFGAAADTNLYRAAADTLKTDDEFQIQRGAGGNPAFGVRVAGDAFPRYQINTDGGLNWGNGAVATDAYIYRPAAGVLRTGTSFHAGNEIAARIGAVEQVIMGYVGAGLGGLKFGTAEDTNLYRSAANTLKTDDNFWAVGGVIVNNVQLLAGSGLPSGGSSGDFYFRLGGGGAGATHVYYNNGGVWIGIA